jgi:hypothetical protein
MVSQLPMKPFLMTWSRTFWPVGGDDAAARMSE